MSGSTGTISALSLPPREAIRFFLGKVNTPTAGWSDVWHEAHNRAFMVAGAATEDLLGSFRAAIAKALEQGTTLAEFRKDFDGIVERTGWVHNGGAGWRSRIIYETNLSMAYSAGRYAQMVEPDTLAAFPYWQYVHSDTKNPRKQHLAWNGLTLRADDGFWKTHYPPNGWGCGCRARPLSARDLGRQGKSGPDQAPPIVTHPFVRPSDGKILQVPDGIDPGFAYNVGEGFAGMPQIPGTARLSPPAGWIPPVPGGPLPDTPRFSTLAEADAALRPAYQAWADRLTTAQRAVLDDYKGPVGRRLNRFLRDQDDWNYARPGEPAKMVKALDEALDRARAPQDLRVFRGVSAEEAQRLAHLGVGDQVITRTFLSTSAIEAPARGMAGSPLRVEIIVPEGTRGAAYIHPFPSYRFPQAEMLLRRRMQMTVVHREGDRLVLRISGTPTVQPLE